MDKNVVSPIISCYVQGDFDILCDYHKHTFETYGDVGFYMSIDTYKVESVVQSKNFYDNIFCGAADDCYITLHDNEKYGKHLHKILDDF